MSFFDTYNEQVAQRATLGNPPPALNKEQVSEV